MPLGKLLCNPGGKEYLRAMISEEAQAYSAVTVDERDAALYPFGKHQSPEEEVVPPITLPSSCGGLRNRVKRLLTPSPPDIGEFAEGAQKALLKAIKEGKVSPGRVIELEEWGLTPLI